MSPYKFDTDKKKLPRSLDRRVRLTELDKDTIKKLIVIWLSDKEIAMQFKVHRKTIYLIRKPEQALKEKEAFKLRRLDWRYYNKEKQTKAIKSLRKYKKQNINKLI